MVPRWESIWSSAALKAPSGGTQDNLAACVNVRNVDRGTQQAGICGAIRQDCRHGEH